MLLQSSSLLSLKWSTNPSICTFHIPCHHSKLLTPLRFSALKTRAIHDEKDQNSQPPVLIQDKENELLNQKGLGQGRYFPITAIQRFDAAAKRIENGVYLGPLGFLTFEGPFSWKNRILAFVFERLRIKVGPFNPFDISIKGKEEREPSNKDKDPFFIWFYIDEEIAVARGRSGGTAFWVRCRRVGYS